MPLLSEVAARPTDEKADELNNSESTALETIASIEGEMSTVSTGEENEHSGKILKHSEDSELLDDHHSPANTLDSTNNTATPDTVKEKCVIDNPASNKLSPRSPASNAEANAAVGPHRDNSQNSDSSDDESSYFRDPRNLPRPKSDGRYSFSSSNSMSELIPPPDLANLDHRGSDLRLSFSEDSDEVQHHHSHHRHPKTSGTHTDQNSGVPEPFSQPGITKIRSYDSLLSGAGTDEDLSSNPSVRDELKNAVDPVRQLPTSVPSGRKSPVLGVHPPSRGSVVFSSPSSFGLDPSPPTISSAYQQNRGYIHPQAQNMSPEQLADWIAAADAAYQQQLMVVDPYFVIEDLRRDGSLPNGSFHSNNSTFEYSEDSQGGNLSEPYVQKYGRSSIHAMGKLPVSNGKEQSFGSNGVRNAGSRPSESPGEGTFTSTVADIADHDGYKQMLSDHRVEGRGDFKVYWKRWLMLMYMSVLNLLSDWTCYSVAPIALLTEQAFGNINPELLVTVFLLANAVASACEPIILSRLGLRRTVLFGALLLMIGSIVKSGGMPPIIEADLQKGQGEWRVYVGFFLVGLSQPLYQCTPALLSASWFPDVERTMATGIALNANQLGIGFAFIFGTLLVVNSDDIPPYFGLLSMISTVTFLGVLVQFEDAPPTPPSDSARVMKGTLEVNLPSVRSMFDSIRNIGAERDENLTDSPLFHNTNRETKAMKQSPPLGGVKGASTARRGDSVEGARPRRRYVNNSESSDSLKQSVFRTNSSTPAMQGPAASSTYDNSVYPAPSPSNVGHVATMDEGRETEDEELERQQQVPVNPFMMQPHMVYGSFFPSGVPPDSSIPNPRQDNDASHSRPEMLPYFPPPSENDYDFPYSYPQFLPYWDQRFQQYAYYQIPPTFHGPMPGAYHQSHQYPPLSFYAGEYGTNQYIPSSGAINEGAEPVLTLTPHHLDINIRDDQVLLSIKACMARKGFIHSLVSFTVSGVVINTLSTFMDYLVRLNGAGREYTGIVGGTFQFVIMISSLVVGKICDTTRAYYSITIFMLVLGAFGLAQCGVSLDAARGNDLRWALVVVALLVGPLQPISTELGVEVAYPLSENTVLVIQQLFSNLLSAMFIPCFKAMKDLRLGHGDAEIPVTEKPEYTFSFYLLIVLHAAATVFFATFNGRYLRHDHELEKATGTNRRARYSGAFQRVDAEAQSEPEYPNERMPLIAPRR